MVAIPNAGVYKDTVVICPRNTTLADAAVLAARWFDKIAGFADTIWMEEGIVIWIQRHVFCVGVGGYIAWVCGAGEVEEEIWENDGYYGCEFC